MEKTFCPHCGTKNYIQELNYTLLQNINGYKISGENIIIENSAKKIKSNYTSKCVSCGYHLNHEIKHKI